MSPEDHEKRIEAVARVLATSPPAIPHYDYDEHHKDALFRLKARLALDAADKAVPIVTEAHHVAVRGEVLKQAAALREHLCDRVEKAEAAARGFADVLKKFHDSPGTGPFARAEIRDALAAHLDLAPELDAGTYVQ